MGKGICDWQQWYSIGSSGTGDPSTLHHEQTIFGEEMHTLITFMVSVKLKSIMLLQFPIILSGNFFSYQFFSKLFYLPLFSIAS